MIQDELPNFHAEPLDPQRPRPHRWEVPTWAWIVFGLLGVVTICFYRFVSNPVVEHSRAFGAVPYPIYAFGAPGRYPMRMPMFGGPFSMGQVSPVHRSLYIANLATRVEDYTISVRQVRSSDFALYQSIPAGRTIHLNSKVLVSLQLMSSSREALDRVASFAPTLRAVADDGTQFTVTDPTIPFQFDHGLGRVLLLSGPPTRAHYLKWLKSEIVLRAPNERSESAGPAPETSTAATNDGVTDKRQPRLAFRIEAIPLPVMPHVFGIAAMRHLTPAQLAALDLKTIDPAAGAVVIQGSPVERLRHLFPPFVPDAGPFHVPNRLILQPEIENLCRLPVVGAPASAASGAELLCRLQPHLALNGEIDVQLLVERPAGAYPALRRSLVLWDHEPAVVLAPAATILPGEDGFIALWLDLYLDMPPPDQVADEPVTCIYTVNHDQPSGDVEGVVTIGDNPVALGTVKLELRRADDGTTDVKSPTSVVVPLDKQGRWQLTRLLTGRYEIRLLSAMPYVSKSSFAGSWQEYARRHDGIERGAWQNCDQKEVDVYLNGTTDLKPWRYVPAR